MFTPQWWKDHPHAAHAYWDHNRHPWNYWWRAATWATVGAAVYGSAYGGEPVYYDYGDNIYYEGDQVYAGGQPVATAEQYYQQASDIAASAPAEPQPDADWLPLGVFALTKEGASDSSMVLQLAVNKEGVITGTYYNTTTNTTRPVKGMIDKKTQRAAWTFADGKNTDIIMETGLYNLTKDQTEALMHFGKDNTQQWIMVRLNQPTAESAKKTQ